MSSIYSNQYTDEIYRYQYLNTYSSKSDIRLTHQKDDRQADIEITQNEDETIWSNTLSNTM